MEVTASTDIQIVKSAVGSAFPATFYGDLSRAVGTRQKAVINLKTKLGDSDKGYFKIANEVELIRTIGSQLVDGKPVDQLCPGGIIERSGAFSNRTSTCISEC